MAAISNAVSSPQPNARDGRKRQRRGLVLDQQRHGLGWLGLHRQLRLRQLPRRLAHHQLLRANHRRQHGGERRDGESQPGHAKQRLLARPQLGQIPARAALYFVTIHTGDRWFFENITGMYVLNAAELIGVPLHHRFALPAQGRSSIILCGAIIEALMAAACEAVAERTSPPAFSSFYCDGSADGLPHRGTTIVQSDGYPIALRYEWRVRTEANFA